MLKSIALIAALALLTGCVTTSSHHYRDKGETYEFYPWTPGSASKVAEEGRKCWLESNRENWDQCQ
jgi:hypothetical protein